MRSAEQKFRRDVAAAVRKAERETNRDLAAAQRRADQQNEVEARRLQRRLESQLRQSRPRVTYTITERQFLGAVRETVAEDDLRTIRERDLFLCHAWADRQHSARELFNALVAAGVDAWFSEEDVDLGTTLARELDRGIRASRVGVVLVTPAMLMALRQGGFADKELGALLATNRVIPVLHDVTHEDLRSESPLLAARTGLSTAGTSLADVAEKIAESVLIT